MNKWLRLSLVWGIPAVVVTLFAALMLTNGNLFAFFDHNTWGSKLYANIWEHLLHGNSLIDPQYAPGEYFLVGANQMVTYFGAMPVVVRAIADIFLPNVYDVNLANLSMVLALLLALGSVWYAVQRLAHGSRNLLLLGAAIVLAILFASPVGYLFVWGWTYHEVIMWGVAWALLFTSVFTMWVFDYAAATRWHGVLMGLAVGMAMLSRPTIGLMLAVPFAFVCVRAALHKFRHNNGREFRLLLPGAMVCAVLGLAVAGINYQRWGNPFAFVKIDRNVQFIELYPERGEAIRTAGEFNINRIGSSLFYYSVPSAGNVSKQFPFVTLDSELDAFNQVAQYDYIEGSRLPITLSMPLLLVFAGYGVWALTRLKPHERRASYWLLAGAACTFVALLAVYATALRYTAELVPVFVFLGLVYLVGLQRGVVSRPSKKTLVAFAVTACVSLYITFVTAVAYKQFVWDVPANVRAQAQQFIHYMPTDRDTKHIINGKRFPVY